MFINPEGYICRTLGKGIFRCVLTLWGAASVYGHMPPVNGGRNMTANNRVENGRAEVVLGVKTPNSASICLCFLTMFTERAMFHANHMPHFRAMHDLRSFSKSSLHFSSSLFSIARYAFNNFPYFTIVSPHQYLSLKGA
jgi:hypothetical protein